MSAIIRMATRLAVVEVLTADPVIASATGGRVYDSEMEAIDPSEPVPVIIVHTESHQGDAFSQNNGGPPFDGALNLVFEIAHVARSTQDDIPVLFRPETTRELEASLDLIEARIPDAIAFALGPLPEYMRRKLLKRIVSMQSDRFASDDIGVRIASRLLTLTVNLHEPEDEIFHPDDDLPSGTYANLPEPLRSLAPLFAAGSSARDTLDLVAAALPAPAYADGFNQSDQSGFDLDVYPNGLRPPPAP